jgi:uncharacterized cupin superfamily protein
MADYTKINLRELENMSVKYGHGEDMEARFATKPLQLQKSGLGMQRVLPNRRIPFKHKHVQQEEVVIVVAGNGSIELDDTTVELKTWDAVRVPPEAVRTVIGGPDGLEMLIVGAPYTDKSDIVMIHE